MGSGPNTNHGLEGALDLWRVVGTLQWTHASVWEEPPGHLALDVYVEGLRGNDREKGKKGNRHHCKIMYRNHLCNRKHCFKIDKNNFQAI